MTVKEFLQLNQSSIGSSGAAWDSCDAINQLNQARSALYGLDNWDGLTKYICVPANCRISLPWFAADVKAAFRCNESIPIESGEYWKDASQQFCGTEEFIRDTGEYSPTPVANSFTCQLGFVANSFADKGKKLSITYITPAGSRVTEEHVLSNEQYSVTENVVSSILSLSKERTEGIVHVNRISTKGVAADRLFGIYPQETSTEYRQYCFSTDTCQRCNQIVLKVKRKYIPFTKDDYNTQIDFIEHALSLAMQAFGELNKRTIDGYKMYQELIRSSINYLKKNTQEKMEHSHDLGDSHDYPSIV